MEKKKKLSLGSALYNLDSMQAKVTLHLLKTGHKIAQNIPKYYYNWKYSQIFHKNHFLPNCCFLLWKSVTLITALILAYGADCSILQLPTSLNKQIAEIKFKQNFLPRNKYWHWIQNMKMPSQYKHWRRQNKTRQEFYFGISDNSSVPGSQRSSFTSEKWSVCTPR